MIGSQSLYVGLMDSSSGAMNYDPGDSKLVKVEVLTNRIILTLQGSSGGAASEKFFDWNDKSKSFQMNFTATR